MNLAIGPRSLFAIGSAALLLTAAAGSSLQDTPSEFSSGTIDLGVVVSDLEDSVDFYTNLIGFTEVPGFAVDGEFCGGAGLTDVHGLKVRVLVLWKDGKATNLKLMALPEVKSRTSDNAFIHSQLGYSYITIRTVSLGPALERLEKAGLSPLAKGPIALPGAGPDGPHLAVVRDPDGNLIELIGSL
jgi:lactoylglutathione lyase